jgi:hypothetical protein
MHSLSVVGGETSEDWKIRNSVLGIFYVGFILFEFIITITTVAYPYGARWPFVVLMDSSMVVAAVLIVWYAWRSKQKA